MPEHPLHTEVVSQQELSTTAVTKRTAKYLALGFLTILLLPMVAQLLFPTDVVGPFPFPPTRNTLREFEKRLTQASGLQQYFQPRVQALLTEAGRFGNEKVTVGKNGWLYYTPGLQYLFGRPVLDPQVLAARAKSMVDKDGVTDPHPNPLPALQQLADDCRKWGIHLIVVPMPDKAQFVPDPLGSTGQLQNPDFEVFAESLEARGVEVVRIRRGNYTGQFLKQDTHWTPTLMDEVAKQLANRAAKWLTPSAVAPKFQTEKRTVSNFGDLVDLLKLPRSQQLYPPEQVVIEQVQDTASTAADVLLLGDSFSLIYSSNLLNWGESAGLGEHLALHLNRQVDRIAVNGSAATGVRQELLRAASEGRLTPKKVIIYEFTIRDLASGDWRPIPLMDPPKLEVPVLPKVITKLSPPIKTDPVIVRGTIEFLSPAIDPANAPYKEALQFGKVRITGVESGKYAGRYAVVVFRAMEERKLLVGGQHRQGDSVHLQLVPLSQATAEIRSMQRSDETTDYDLTPMFVVKELP